MPRSFARHTIVAIRAGQSTDRYGQPVLDWNNPTEHTIDQCVVDPIQGTETFDAAGARVLSRWRVVAPAGADLEATDRVRHDGQVYDIDGEVQRFDSPTGRLAHVELYLKRVTTSST